MKPKYTRLIAALAAVLALAIVVPASASAASWHVGGEPLVSSVELAPKTTMLENIKFTYSTLNIECTGSLQLKSASIAAPATGQIEHLVFTGCKATGGNCNLVGTTIETKPLKIEAALGKQRPEDSLVLKPKSGTMFAEFEFSGTSCALAGLVELTGKATFLLPKGQEELATQGLSVRAEPGELKWGSASFTLKGRVDTSLSSGKAWSFR